MTIIMMPSDAAPSIGKLQGALKAVERNMDMATGLHEVWKPTAFDNALHERMGISFASHAFNVVKTALRREMLLALVRVWDKTQGTQSLSVVVRSLREPTTWADLVAHRTASLGYRFLDDAVESTLVEIRDEVFAINDAYSKEGTQYHVLHRLVKLRNVDLAHSQAAEAGAKRGVDSFDEQVEEIYRDTQRIVSKLLSLVNGNAYSYIDVGHVYAHYAKRFWASVRGENTEGHPDYRPPHDV